MPTDRDTGPRDREPMVDAGRSLGQASAMLNFAVAERLGLPPTAWECLSHLFEHGAMPAGRLAELTGLTTGAITGLVDRLEREGLVARTRDTDDRRKVIVEVAPGAWDRVFPMFAPMLAEMHALNRRYSAEQMEVIQSCMRSAAEILRRHALRIRAGQ